jgi:hypothetical protein
MVLLSKEVVLSLIAIYFFSNYRAKYCLFFMLMNCYKVADNFMNYVNSILAPEYFQLNDETKSDDFKEETIVEPKYEDKYLENIRKLDTEFTFDDEDELTKTEKYNDFLSILKQGKFETYLNKLNEIEEKIATYEKSEDDYCSSDSEDDEDIELIKTKEERVKLLLEEKAIVSFEYDSLKLYLDTVEGEKKIMVEAQDLATKYVINKKLDKLMNCYVIEKTPLGNVLMIYNNTRSTFSYYSDSTIPYRYLEVVARKYVKTFACRPIFVDMDEELKKAEEKWELERIEKETKEEEKKKIEQLKSQKQQIVEQKKSVFAKFKSYNKDSAATKAMAVPPKNSIPNNKVTETSSDEKVLLKENANRYSYEGKLSNFNFLKKVDRKVVDKKYAMTFADFKRLQEEKKNKK